MWYLVLRLLKIMIVTGDETLYREDFDDDGGCRNMHNMKGDIEVE